MSLFSHPAFGLRFLRRASGRSNWPCPDGFTPVGAFPKNNLLADLLGDWADPSLMPPDLLKTDFLGDDGPDKDLLVAGWVPENLLDGDWLDANFPVDLPVLLLGFTLGGSALTTVIAALGVTGLVMSRNNQYARLVEIIKLTKTSYMYM